MFVPLLQLGRSVRLGCFQCWHKIPEEILILMPGLSLQLSMLITLSGLWKLLASFESSGDALQTWRAILEWTWREWAVWWQTLTKHLKKIFPSINSICPTTNQNSFTTLFACCLNLDGGKNCFPASWNYNNLIYSPTRMSYILSSCN